MDTKDRVAEVIEKVRSALQQDGGDIQLLDVKGDVVHVRLKGACSGCPMAQMTLKNYVEAMIKKRSRR